ncbi:reverse transcriptase domain-containing protein [Tanacetum coccineum]
MVKEGIVLGHKISRAGIEGSIIAFETLKKELTKAPIMVKPDWSLSFKLMCDASDYAVGAVLGQKSGKTKPRLNVGYFTLQEIDIEIRDRKVAENLAARSPLPS